MGTRVPNDIIFIVGTGRSGTTVVLNVFAGLPGMTAIPRLAGKFPSTTNAAALLARFRLGPDVWIRPSAEATAMFAEAGLSHELQLSMGARNLSAESAAALDMARLANRFKRVGWLSNANYLVVKNTANCGRVPLLASTFPTARFLHVVRRPEEVIASLLRTDFWPNLALWWAGGRTPVEYARDASASAEEVAAQHWFHQVARAQASLSALDPARWTVLAYQDFVKDPVHETIRSLGSINVPAPSDAAILRVVDQVDVRTPPSLGRPSNRNVSEALSSEVIELARQVGVH